MPYVDQEARAAIAMGCDPRNPGELNYALTVILLRLARNVDTRFAVSAEMRDILNRYLGVMVKRDGRVGYTQYNEIIGALECCRLEFVRRKLGLPRDKVAVFGSWDRFEVMSEHEAGSLFVNAGFMPYPHPDPGMRRLSDMQEGASAWDEERFDVFTSE